MSTFSHIAFRVLVCIGLACNVQAQTGPLRFRVQIAPSLGSQPQTGRLIVLLTTRSDMRDEVRPILADTSVWVAAKEIRHWKPGEVLDFNPDELAFPDALSHAPAGDYRVMALLDVNHRYAYSGPYRGLSAGDLRSRVVAMKDLDPRRTAPIEILLTDRIPEVRIAVPPGAELIDVVSPTLSRFWGRPIHMRGVVRFPSDYASTATRYPSAYYFGGFGLDMERITGYLNLPPPPNAVVPNLITFILDHHCPTGNHNFTDSVNNGPWATALTSELIPYLESKYRIDPDPRRRFVFGYSSGASTALWLQVQYPNLFGGVWAMAPGPPDFRSAFGIDLHARPIQNVYRDGVPWARLLAQQGRVLGDYGGVISSLDWIYSPRWDDGRPMQLFDRDTGAVNEEVAAAWLRYDLAGIIRNDANRLRPLLDGKIRLIVGTLDMNVAPDRLFEETLRSIGIRASFTYLEGMDHNAVGMSGASPVPGSLLNRIFGEMEAAAGAVKE